MLTHAMKAIAGVLMLVKRPRKTPIYALSIYGSIGLSQIFILLGKRFSLSLEDAPIVLSISFTFLAVLVLINMPLRDPRLPQSNISKYLSPPTDEERTPEDDLTLFQFFTSSWMSALINLGSKRQLNANDVWALGYEFQHRLLHNAFQELHGSVLRRILIANFLDVFLILPSLAVVHLALSFASPLLLQQLLLSLENPASPRRAPITYAILTFVFRSLQAQIGTFNNWYSRRAYERSRGEMITMLTRKALTRKTLTIFYDSSTNEDQVKDVTLAESTPKNLSERARAFWNKLSFAKRNQVKDGSPAVTPIKESATTGRILSLVRQDIYEVAQR